MTASDASDREILLSVQSLHKRFDRRRGIRQALMGTARRVIDAVDGISFEIRRGEVLGLAGESGSGKSVTGELVAALQSPTSGRISFEGVDISQHTKEQRRIFRRHVSMVFQDPYDALNPRLRVRQSVTEPLRIHGMGDAETRRRMALEAIERVGLRPADHYAEKFPHQLSGGERQRAAVARALVTKPKLLIADEPTTMLDVSVRMGLLNLLKEMTTGSDLAMIFISHDLTTLSYLCDRIVIVYLGRVAEMGPAEQVLTAGLHPYTQLLASAIPVPDPDAGRPRVRMRADGSEPSPLGCLFAPRCPHAMDHCPSVIPEPTYMVPEHLVACHLYGTKTTMVGGTGWKGVKQP
jgi:peptide/nickel transport system ATP-binding protein